MKMVFITLQVLKSSSLAVTTDLAEKHHSLGNLLKLQMLLLVHVVSRLFIVPKYLVNEDGSLGDRNHVGPGSIEYKMGIKASATCVMNFDGAKGYLVVKENEGLAAMFVMMNYERLSMGIPRLRCF